MTELAEIKKISEDGGEVAAVLAVKDLLDRFEMIYSQTEEISLIRRFYNDQDLSSLFKLADNDDLRRAVMEKNVYSLFRVLESYDCLVGEHEDLRKAVTEKNVNSLVRCLSTLGTVSGEDTDELRKTILEKNLHSLFRVVEVDTQQDLDDLRKAILNKDLNAMFRVLTHWNNDLDDLRKAVMNQDLNALFRVIGNIQVIDETHQKQIEDLRKAITNQDLNAMFRVLENLQAIDETFQRQIEDLRRAMQFQNEQSIFRLLEVFSGRDLTSLKRSFTDQDPRSICRLYQNSDELRKAAVDDSLHAIFKLYDDVVELRKAVIENNSISVLNLLEFEDLKKLLQNDNRYSLYRLLDQYIPQNNLVSALRNIETQKIEFQHDCISRGQLRSKLWIIDTLRSLNIELGCVFICAGWYATLSLMIFENEIPVEKIRSFDIDPSCEHIAEIFNKPWVRDAWKFKAVTKDIMDINYKIEEYTVTKYDGSTERLWDVPDTVINTSCEHIDDFDCWYSKIPSGTLLILQTNDFTDIEDHVNCSETLDDFAEKTPMQECLYQGELDLDQYKRFMRIGYK